VSPAAKTSFLNALSRTRFKGAVFPRAYTWVLLFLTLNGSAAVPVLVIATTGLGTASANPYS